MMKNIKWKRVVIAAIWAELLIAVIHMSLRSIDFQAIRPVTYTSFILFMFLGGLWTARKIERRFTLHGALVGLFANIFWYVPVYSLALINQLPWDFPDNVLLSGLISSSIKILAGALGGYIGGKRRKNQLSV
jgi:putative membrane protein (TIGR04086 family)